MKIKILSAALGAVIVAAGGTALAQTATPAAPQPRAAHAGDANKDGILTREEALARVDARFARADANKDGKITADERPGKRWRHRGTRGAEGKDAQRPARTAPADANGDGAVTLAEQRAHALKGFAYVDRNGDGRIDKAERQQFREAAAMFGDPGKRGPRGHRHGRHGGRHASHPAGAPEAPKAQ
jgi:hypothetical protein